uniref:Uncharacterized protein n=1 Tax=Neospora caninum (strain Liverpool) TaxID=572307 RepID=A0A0F7UMA1_NEOCL|nr:TPA: hypothetical protein BN1204_050450 [Neospora caninum Liverpool]
MSSLRRHVSPLCSLFHRRGVVSSLRRPLLSTSSSSSPVLAFLPFSGFSQVASRALLRSSVSSSSLRSFSSAPRASRRPSPALAFLERSVARRSLLSASRASSLKTKTRDQRHPYLGEARRLVRNNETVRQVFGSPLEFQNAEDTTDSSGLHKRAKMYLSGPKATGSVFVTALLPDTVGEGDEEDSQSLFAGDSLDWNALRERPYLLKLWLFDRMRTLYLATRSVVLGEVYEDVKRERGASAWTNEKGEAAGEEEEEAGARSRWAIDSLFVHIEKRQGETRPGKETNERSKVLIAVKGNPYDNPDIEPFIKREGSTRGRNRHPIGGFLLLALLALLCRQTYSEIRGAIDRAACYQYLNYFTQNHPDLRRILCSTAQRNAARVKAGKEQSTSTAKAREDNAKSREDPAVEKRVNIQVSYFAGKMTPTSIKGCASLTFTPGEHGGKPASDGRQTRQQDVDTNEERIPNIAELRIEALRPNTSAPFKALVSSVRVIREQSDDDVAEGVPFPLLLSYTLPPTRIPPFRPSVSWSSFFSGPSLFGKKKRPTSGKDERRERKV